MGSMTRRSWLTALGMAPLVAGGAGGSAREQKRERRTWLKIPPREAIRKYHLPGVELVSHQGKKVRFYDDLIRDKKVVINFMYAHCEGICIPVTTNLVRVQKLFGERMGRDLFFYSITLKPEEDTAAELKHYAAMHGVGPGWLFLTGAPENTELLRRRLGFVDPDPVADADKSNHIGNILYGNERLMLWAVCPGLAHAKFLAQLISWQVDRPVSKAG